MLVNNSCLGCGENDTTRSPSQYVSAVLLVSSQPEVFHFRVNNKKSTGLFFVCFLNIICWFSHLNPVISSVILIGAYIPGMLYPSLSATMPVLSLNLHQNLFLTGKTDPGSLSCVWSACISPTAGVPSVALSVKMPLPVGMRGRGYPSANAHASLGWCLQRELLHARAWFTICFPFQRVVLFPCLM